MNYPLTASILKKSQFVFSLRLHCKLGSGTSDTDNCLV